MGYQASLTSGPETHSGFLRGTNSSPYALFSRIGERAEHSGASLLWGVTEAITLFVWARTAARGWMNSESQRAFMLPWEEQECT